MRRFFTLLLVTPLLASCSDSVTPVAPSDAAFTLEESPIVESEAPLGEWTLGESESPFEASTLEEWTSLGASTLADSPLQGAPSTGEVMEFGNPTVGTGFPTSHDGSFHGRDRVIPGTVVIDAGQKVTFHVNPGHRVGIYKPGTRPEDIAVGTGNFVLDTRNRVALQAAPVPVISFTFHSPGRFLVICAVRRHFVEANMYGWVIVR